MQNLILSCRRGLKSLPVFIRSVKRCTRILDTDEFLMKAVQHLKDGMAHPEKASPLFEFKDKFIFPGKNINRTGNYIEASISSKEKKFGLVRVYNPGNISFILPEEQKFIDQVAGMIGNWLSKREMEEELRQSREDLYITLQSIGDGVIATDLAGEIVRMNPVAEELTGWKLEEARGRNIEELFSLVNAGTRERVGNPVKKVLESGKLMGLANHTVMVARNGREMQIADSAAPILDSEGKTRGVVFVFSDVTDKYRVMEQLRQSREKYRLLAEKTETILWELDLTENRWTYVAPQVKRILGYSPQEWTDIQFWIDRLHPNDRGWAYNYCMECTQKGQEHSFEYRFRKKDGTYVWLLDEVKVDLEGGKPVRMWGSMREITERKNLELLQKAQYKIANNILVADDLELLVETVREELSILIDTSFFSVTFYNEKKNVLTAPFNKGKKGEIAEYPIEDSPAGIVVKEGRSLLLGSEDIEELIRKERINFDRPLPKKWLGVPLRCGGGVEGVIIVQSFDNPDAYDRSSMKFLESVANQLSVYLERKRSREKVLKLSRVVEQSPVSIIITDTDSKIEYVNPRFVDQTGYSGGEVIGMDASILKSGYHGESFYREIYDTILSGKDWHGEILSKRKDGELYWERAVISQLFNEKGEITNFVAIMEDITEKKRLVNELVRAKEKAEESNKLKSAFLANMSHEIRTPMNSIVGFSALLKDRELSDEKKDEFIDIIKSNSDYLLGLIEGIIDISRVESGNVEIKWEKIDARELFRDLKERMQPLKPGLELRYNAGDTPLFISDRVKLNQVLSNLISNAIKFTSEGYVEYSLRKEKDTLLFSVEDTGTGIKEKDREKIFRRFVQGETSIWMSRQGTGLGLPLAKAYIEKLGGKMWVESNWGKGSTFWFTIPYISVEIHETEVSEPAGNTPSLDRSLNILVAEDDMAGYMLIEEILKNAGAEIVHAPNGREAVKLVSSREFDLVLMDIRMPVMNGLEATRKIKSINPKLPVIAVTANALKDEQEDAFQAGCDYYLSKPLQSEKLFDLIKKFAD